MSISQVSVVDKQKNRGKQEIERKKNTNSRVGGKSKFYAEAKSKRIELSFVLQFSTSYLLIYAHFMHLYQKQMFEKTNEERKRERQASDSNCLNNLLPLVRVLLPAMLSHSVV